MSSIIRCTLSAKAFTSGFLTVFGTDVIAEELHNSWKFTCCKFSYVVVYYPFWSCITTQSVVSNFLETWKEDLESHWMISSHPRLAQLQVSACIFSSILFSVSSLVTITDHGPTMSMCTFSRVVVVRGRWPQFR